MLLKPTTARLIITAMLLLLAYGGYAQSEAFTEKDAGQPPLPMARLFEPIPDLWELWVCSRRLRSRCAWSVWSNSSIPARHGSSGQSKLPTSTPSHASSHFSAISSITIAVKQLA
jgi:hypothetical protein